MPKFTPGPWKTWCETACDGTFLVGPAGDAPAIVVGITTLENAALIAAAPDLYEIASLWDKHMWREHDCTGPDDCLHCATREVLAKVNVAPALEGAK